MATIFDEKSVIEDKTIIQVKIEGNEEHSNTLVGIVQVKTEADDAEYSVEQSGEQALNDNSVTADTIKVEPLFIEEIDKHR